MATVEPFKRLVKLVARAFYDDVISQKEATPWKPNKTENKGISVVVLDALTRRQWVKEEELAKSLKLHPKQVRRALRVLEADMLVVREDRKAKKPTDELSVKGENQACEMEKTKTVLQSYCCLDYAQVCDVVRYRIHRVRKMIKEELEDKNTVQEYSALEASRLINLNDMNFHCESCDAELVVENDTLVRKQITGGDSEENSKRRQREKLKQMLEKLEGGLRPLDEQLQKIKDLRPPDYGSFQQWQQRALLREKNSSDQTMQMPLESETKVEVDLVTREEAKQGKKEEPVAPVKIMPPWMIREGMNLQVKRQESDVLDQKPESLKPVCVDKKLQEDYARAFHAAYMAQQQERKVGEKTKREAEIDWEDEPAKEPAKTQDEAGTIADDEIEWE